MSLAIFMQQCPFPCHPQYAAPFSCATASHTADADTCTSTSTPVVEWQFVLIGMPKLSSLYSCAQVALAGWQNLQNNSEIWRCMRDRPGRICSFADAITAQRGKCCLMLRRRWPAGRKLLRSCRIWRRCTGGSTQSTPATPWPTRCAAAAVCCMFAE